MPEDAQPPTNEVPGEQPQPTPESAGPVADLSPAQFQALVGILNELLTSLGTLRTTSERATAALISYMDRVILLSGGALTLIFTVIGTLSSHLHEIGRSAIHIPLVLAACWLLVSAILNALIYNVASINMQRKTDVHLALQGVNSKMKLHVLTIVNNVAAANLPDLVIDKDFNKNNAPVVRLIRLAGVLVQGSIASAFVCLTLFIQANLPLLLNAMK
jgi:hypothetical protein